MGASWSSPDNSFQQPIAYSFKLRRVLALFDILLSGQLQSAETPVTAPKGTAHQWNRSTTLVWSSRLSSRSRDLVASRLGSIFLPRVFDGIAVALTPVKTSSSALARFGSVFTSQLSSSAPGITLKQPEATRLHESDLFGLPALLVAGVRSGAANNGCAITENGDKHRSMSAPESPVLGTRRKERGLWQNQHGHHKSIHDCSLVVRI